MILFVVLGLSSVGWAGKSPYDWALIRLDYTRQEKVLQLRNFCARLHALAGQATRDKFVRACFDITLQYAEAVDKGPVPESLVERVQELRDGFNSYYIQNYFAFYDILFVNAKGKVFYTVRKEDDLYTNLLQSEDAPGTLRQALGTASQEEVFIDFHNYGPSSKPAAFFVESMYRGQTGETFLVNQEGYMLTESNFEGASTILKKRLDDRNVQEKFAEGQGHRIVTDYRGRTALTSFEVIEFLGTQWLVVAKMDVDEIVTEHYIQHRRYYADRLLVHLEEAPIAPLRDEVALAVRETLRIDMDEFLWADHGERLHTFGVSTCTGVLAAYPGKLAYLAHVSPRDEVYGADETNLLAPMIKRIKAFDIYRCERHRVVFFVVATHLKTVLSIVDKLVDEGFFLSQVHVMHNPHAESATITYDYSDNDLIVTWRLPESGDGRGVHLPEDAANVGGIIQEVMHREDETPLGSVHVGAGHDSMYARRGLTHTSTTGQEGGPDMHMPSGLP